MKERSRSFSKNLFYLPKSAIEIISHWQCKGVLFFKHQWKNVLFITNCEFKLSMLMHCMNKLVELCPWFFFLNRISCWKKIRLVRLFGISVSWWTPVFPQITSLCAKSPCQRLDRTIRVYTKASSTYESKWKKFFVMKSFFRGKMEGFEKEKIEKYDKYTNFFSDS